MLNKIRAELISLLNEINISELWGEGSQGPRERGKRKNCTRKNTEKNEFCFIFTPEEISILNSLSLC